MEVMMMNSTIMGILAIVTMVIWIMVSAELSKSPKKQEEKENSRRKLIVLMSAGMLFTIPVVVSLIQNIPF
jgi:glucose uptake protein GlcU